MCSSTLSFTSVLDGVTGRQDAPAALSLGRRPCIHCTTSCVGPRNGLYGCEKSLSRRDSIPGPSSPYRVAITTTLSEDNEKRRLVLQNPVVTTRICTARFKIQNICLLPKEVIYVFCMDPSTHSDFSPVNMN
jgi:hypothetical protein